MDERVKTKIEPKQPEGLDEQLDLELEGTFPASDPPSLVRRHRVALPSDGTELKESGQGAKPVR